MTLVIVGLALCLGVLLAAFDSSDSATAQRLERYSTLLIVAWGAVVTAGVVYTISDSLIG